MLAEAVDRRVRCPWIPADALCCGDYQTRHMLEERQAHRLSRISAPHRSADLWPQARQCASILPIVTLPNEIRQAEPMLAYAENVVCQCLRELTG